MKINYFTFIFFLTSLKVLGQIDGYTTIDTLIAMRDGIRLYTEIYVPENTPEKLPIILTLLPFLVRTPIIFPVIEHLFSKLFFQVDTPFALKPLLNRYIHLYC